MSTIRDRLDIDLGAIPYPRAQRDVSAKINRRIVDTVHAIFSTLCEWQASYLMRQRMKELDDRLLDDIGLTREDVDREADKPFWQN